MIALLLAAALAADAVLPPGNVPPAVAELARSVRRAPLPERIEAISAAFAGAPYVVDPAGEGVAPDPDPPGRYDAFDCLTYVEEVLALALAADPVDAGRVRHALRYGDGPAVYENRRHFMELQWLPGAVDAGWLRDVTATYGPVVRLEREVDEGFWHRWSGVGRFRMPPEAFPTGRMALDVLPLAEARAVADRIRPGTLLLVVRTDRPGVPYWVAHLGFVVGAERRVFRDASRLRSSMRVRDHDLAAYLGGLAAWERWPVLGVALFEPVEQLPPRALTPPAAGSPNPPAR